MNRQTVRYDNFEGSNDRNIDSNTVEAIDLVADYANPTNNSNVRTMPVRPGAFVFCERISGAMRFQVEATEEGTLPVEQAASLLAMNCLVRGHAPCDYTVLVVPSGGLLDPVGQRAKELLGAWREFGCDVELSGREKEVLECVLLNLSNKEIGQRLNISERTVKFHVSSLLMKFNVRDRVSLMRQATIGMIPASVAPNDTLFGLPVSGK